MTRGSGLPAFLRPANVREVSEPLGPCPSCGTTLEASFDAIGRMRERCPRCDGVARPTGMHASLQATQQALVPIVKAGAYTLPPIAPGQLRCQRCAHGVAGNARYCPPCVGILSAPKPKRPKAAEAELRCERCRKPIERKIGRPPRIHDECLTPAEWAQRKAKRAYNDRVQKKAGAA